jgi:hypothetical protein
MFSGLAALPRSLVKETYVVTDDTYTRTFDEAMVHPERPGGPKKLSAVPLIAN